MSTELEPVVFGATYESLYKAAGERLDDRGKELIRAAGVDLDHILPAYPFAEWRGAIEAFGQAVYPKEPIDEALFLLGRDFVQGLRSTVLGSAIHAMGKLIGPRRTLERMTHNSRSANNFSDMKLEPLPDGVLRMISKIRDEAEPRTRGHVISPHYFRGILHETILATGGKDPRVSLEKVEPGNIHWFRIEMGQDRKPD
jgi:uncharacterized protein (TIGR02265 family)